jgi:hypothetical protein
LPGSPLSSPDEGHLLVQSSRGERLGDAAEPSWNGNDTDSVKINGAAPLPPVRHGR